MKILSLSAFLLSLKLSLVGVVFSLHISKKVEREINKVFEIDKATFIQTLNQDIPGIDKDRLYTIFNQGNALGYAYVGEASSQTDTFEYLVVFDANFAVKKSKSTCLQRGLWK